MGKQYICYNSMEDKGPQTWWDKGNWNKDRAEFKTSKFIFLPPKYIFLNSEADFDEESDGIIIFSLCNIVKLNNWTCILKIQWVMSFDLWKVKKFKSCRLATRQENLRWAARKKVTGRTISGGTRLSPGLRSRSRSRPESVGWPGVGVGFYFW